MKITDYKKEWKSVFWVLLGNTIYCFGIAAFILPLGLITGGTTGLGLILEHHFGFPVEVFAAIFNILMFGVAWFILGASFALTTMISTFYFPLILAILQEVEAIQNLTQDPMLATICAGILMGIGIGVVIRAGASTGGMDVPPLVLNKKLGISVPVGLYACDFLILLGQIMFCDREKTLYGCLLVVIYTYVMDKVLVSGKSQVEAKIISKKYLEINEAIQQKLDRGSTLLKAETGYLHKEAMLVMTVVSNREIARLNQLVLDIDPKAFVIINEAKEVMGRGFTLHKKNR